MNLRITILGLFLPSLVVLLNEFRVIVFKDKESMLLYSSMNALLFLAKKYFCILSDIHLHVV